MRVGLTFDLRDHYLAAGYSAEDTAEFDSIGTIDSLAGALERLGLEVDRVGTVRQLAQRLVAGDRWELIFNIAEGLKGVGREAQVPALLDAYEIPYTFSDPMVMGLALHKGMTKHVIRDQGIPTAPFAVIESRADLAGLELPYPLFAKPVAEGTGKGVTPASRVTTPAALRRVVGALLERFRLSDRADDLAARDCDQHEREPAERGRLPVRGAPAPRACCEIRSHGCLHPVV